MRASSALFALACSLPTTAWAAPGNSRSKGMALAKSGDCVAAVPLLEKAEAEAHRPATAAALARCHVALGELYLAWEIYAGLAKERASPDWTAADTAATRDAGERADELDARLPRVTLTLPKGVSDVQAKIGDRSVHDLGGFVRVPPDEKVTIVVTAPGYDPFETKVVLGEGERRRIGVALVPRKSAGSPAGSTAKGPEPPAGAQHWLGARFRGLLVPTFVMNIVAEGGTTTYWPGGFVTYTTRVSDVDLVTSIGVTSYALPLTPFKPHGTPDTEWELVESDLVGLTASLDILYVIPLDAREEVALRHGGGFGLGWAFAGDLYRTQSYPEDGEPGDPSTYEKCEGPNDPPGTFRYCNQLDKDAHRYGGPDKAWGDGGARPVVYPWLALPQVAIAYRPIPELALDFEIGLTLNGFLTGVGGRYGL